MQKNLLPILILIASLSSTLIYTQGYEYPRYEENPGYVGYEKPAHPRKKKTRLKKRAGYENPRNVSYENPRNAGYEYPRYMEDEGIEIY